MSIDTAVARLAERAFTTSQVLDRAANAPRTACCGTPVQGTAASKWCGTCGMRIPQWSIDHETHAPIVPRQVPR